MSPIFTKGLLKGAALAVAGAAALGAGSAESAPACTTGGSFGTFATPCSLGTYDLHITSFSDPNTLISTDSLSQTFGPTGINRPAGSFNFTVTANQPGGFFTFSDLLVTGGVSSVTTPFFTFNATGDSWTAPNTLITSISGVYTYDAAPLSISSLKFSTDVPVPLPVVGAGLAFGFTRNLRKRAKSVA
jgi:hypothetical protein